MVAVAYRGVAALLVLILLGLSPAAAQELTNRTPNLSGGWVGVPWMLHVDLPHRFQDARPGEGVDLAKTTTFRGGIGLPLRTLVGAAYAPLSPVSPGEADEIELLVRHALLSDATAPVDLSITAAYNTAASSVDGEIGVARWLGPVRLLAAGRVLGDARGALGTKAALVGGVVWQPLMGRAPLAIAADVASPVVEGAEPSWSAGLQIGLPHTAVTLSLQASNAPTTTLQGATAAPGSTLYGFSVTTPIPFGYLTGGYPAREATMESVSEDVPGEPDAVVDIARYTYGATRIEVPAGSVIEWVNRDSVVHTATAEDGAWDSGAIRPGQRWRARFDAPGIYPYYCGPHPFMKGVVIVR